MTKPLFRWTIGPVHPRGFKILEESVHHALKIFKNTFDLMICHNALNQEQTNVLKNIVRNQPIELFNQNWKDCPIDDPYNKNLDQNGDFYESGTLWKVCPARLRPECHEIIIDNDVVLFQFLDEIKQFLNSNKKLVLQDIIRYFSRYDHLLEPNVKYNSGIIGLPPGFNFGDEINKVWHQNNNLTKLDAGDEQGLLTYCLTKDKDFILIDQLKVLELHQTYTYKKHSFNGQEEGLHFVEANRAKRHVFWKQYENYKKTGVDDVRFKINKKLIRR